MAQGAIYQTFDTDTLRDTIRTVIDNIAPRDTPVLALLGTGNDFKLEYKGNHKYEWLTDTLRVRTGTLGANIADTSTTSVTLTDASKLKPGDVIEVGTEYLWIGAVNTTTNVATGCIRGWGGTTAATHTSGDTWTYKYSARLEGATSDDSPYTNPSRLYNEAQIMHFEIEVTGSEEISPRIGIADQFAYQIAKVLGGRGQGSGGDLLIDLNNTFYYGKRVSRVGKTTAGAMGGIETFVTTNVKDASSLTSGVLTYELILDLMQDQWAAGGMPTHLIMNATQKRKLERLFDGFRTMEQSSTKGGFAIQVLDTDFGSPQIVLDRWCPSDRIYSVQKDTMGWITYRDWFMEELGKVGDFKEMQIIGEFGFVCINEEANGYIKSLATS